MSLKAIFRPGCHVGRGGGDPAGGRAAGRSGGAGRIVPIRTEVSEETAVPESTGRGAFTLVELLVIIALIGLLVALLLPAVQAAREAARRVRCTNNLKQLALAAHGYHDVVGCFPLGAYFPKSKLLNSNSGPYTFAILPYLELGVVFDAINFDVAPDFSANATIHGVGVAGLWCPSDPTISETVDLANVLYDDPWRSIPTRYSSYAANCGSWFLLPLPGDSTRDRQRSALNGVIHEGSAVRIDDVTDGAANTILFGEHARGIGPAGRRNRWHWWTSSIGTQFTSMWPINPHHKAGDSAHPSIPAGGSVYLVAASSYHPGGANFAFVDGSVRFLQDSIDSWPFGAEDANPLGVIYSPATKLFSLDPAARLGVYQALSTRHGGEVISDDSN